MNERCENCRFWNPLPGYIPMWSESDVEIDDEARPWRGECRRFPPHCENDVVDWPLLEREMWCGEWKPVREEKPPANELDEKSIVALRLDARALSALWDNSNIKTIGHLRSLVAKDLLKIKNFGDVALRDVRHKLGKLGLALRDELPWRDE